ncbi:MAG: FAD-binding protein [Acidobacteriota bacterium]|nr:FAD-binding protein [Acidobacteriota bacterium]
MIVAAMHSSGVQEADFLVAGSGVAGLRAAIELAPHGSVLILTKDNPADSTSRYASGGIVFALEDGAGVSVHAKETIRQGDGLCREEAVRALVDDGPTQIRQLVEWGASFEERNATNGQAGESGARRPRLVRSASGPIGADILAALTAKASKMSSLKTKAGAILLDLIIENGEVSGAVYLDEPSGTIRKVRSKSVLLSTGGLGQAYAETTNPPGASGDGIALAYRAGALLSDLEFVQFHPTALCSKSEPKVMLPRALREKGAYLRNLELERFMPRYHEAGELAPPETVARAIVCEMLRERGEFVYLDLTGLTPESVKKHFPLVYSACMASNIDITCDLVPTRPAAHFAIGGVATGVDGATTIRGLFAVGEVACTGVHGANRLANNSLLEGLVFGTRAARAMAANAPPAAFPAPPAATHAGAQDLLGEGGGKPLPPDAARREIRRLMWDSAGVIRHGDKIKEALKRLASLSIAPTDSTTRPYVEAENLLLTARLIARCADARTESRGAHYRTDYPLKNEPGPARHSFVSRERPVYFK